MSHFCDHPDLHRTPGVALRRPRRHGPTAFTIVEAVIALSVLGVFALSSIYALMSFNDRASRNRNAEAARAILESRIDAVLAQATLPAPTAAGTDLDGDGVTDGVLTASSLPLLVQRNAGATAVVTGDLYTLITQVGTSVGLPADPDLVAVQYMLRYSYRGQTYTSKLVTFKSAL